MRASKKEKERARHREISTHIWMWHDTSIRVTWLIHIWRDTERTIKTATEQARWRKRVKERRQGEGGGEGVGLWEYGVGKCHIHEYIMSYTNSRYERKCWWKRCMLHVWMSNGGHMNEMCLSRTHITNGDAQGSVTCMIEWWCQLHEWVMSVTWRSHVTYMNESLQLHEQVESYTHLHHEQSGYKHFMSCTNSRYKRKCWW